MVDKNKELEGLSPEPILRMLSAYWLTEILNTAIVHGFFTIIEQGKHSIEEIATAAQTSRRGTEMLLNVLAGLDLLAKKERKYFLTPLSETYLVPDKSSYCGDLRYAIINIPGRGWSRLFESVKTGKPAGALSPEDAESKIWEKMALGTAPVVRPLAEYMCDLLGIGEKRKDISVLDVGGGAGIFGMVIAQRDTGARITQNDWQNVNELAKKLVSDMGIGDQFAFMDGDFKQIDFGSERYDLVVLSHICHQESASSNEKLINKCFRALKSGGTVVINDFIPNDQYTAPVFPLMFSLNMLVHTPEGKSYSEGEYRRWLQESGFQLPQRHDVLGLSTLLVANKI